MEQNAQPEQEWIDFLLGELENPDAEKRIQFSLEKDGDMRSAYEDLREVISQLKTFYSNERNPMIDLTFEQKQELYSNFTDIFPRSHREKNWWFPHLRLALSGMAFAFLVMATVPIIQWITPPEKFPPPSGGIEYVYDTPPAPYVPPKPPDAVKEEDKIETPKIEFHPSVEDLTYPQTTTGNSIWGIGQINFEPSDISIEDDILNLVDVDVVPRVLSKVAPAYPAEMRNYRLSGSVIIEFIVDENGYVEKPVIVQSSNRGFDRVSLDSIRRWRFEPGQKDGKVVKVRMRMPFVFNLK